MLVTKMIVLFPKATTSHFLLQDFWWVVSSQSCDVCQCPTVWVVWFLNNELLGEPWVLGV